MKSHEPYTFKVAYHSGKTVNYKTFDDFVFNVLNMGRVSDSLKEAYVASSYQVARNIAKQATGKYMKAEPVLNPGWEEVYLLKNDIATFTFKTFEEFEKTVARDCGADVYESTARRELDGQMALLGTKRCDDDVIQGIHSLINIVHEKGPDQKVYVALFPEGTEGQVDTCEILWSDDEQYYKMILLMRIAERAGFKVGRQVRTCKDTVIDISLKADDYAFLKSKGLDAHTFAKGAVDLALNKLRTR